MFANYGACIKGCFQIIGTVTFEWRGDLDSGLFYGLLIVTSGTLAYNCQLLDFGTRHNLHGVVKSGKLKVNFSHQNSQIVDFRTLVYPICLLSFTNDNINETKYTRMVPGSCHNIFFYSRFLQSQRLNGKNFCSKIW